MEGRGRHNRTTPSSGGPEASALSALIDSAVALAGSTIAASSERAPLVVGGVDLSRVDFTRPFMVDFSVPRGAKPEQKAIALRRLKSALEALRARFPMWVCDTSVSVKDGVFRLVVNPIQYPAQLLTRGLAVR